MPWITSIRRSAFCRTISHKYAGLRYCRVEMYADRVACCPLVSHDEHADGTYRRTDGHQTVTLRFPLGAARLIMTAMA